MIKKILLLILFVFLNTLIYPEDINLIKRTVVIFPVYYQSNMKEYEYLNDIIRDTLKAKLSTTQIFDFINFTNIDESIKQKSFIESDYIDNEKLLDLLLTLGGDVFILAKYSIENGNINIAIEAYDLLVENITVKSSIICKSSIEILNSIVKISNEIASKMKINFKKIDKVVLDNKIKEIYGKEKSYSYNIEKDIVRVENELVSKFYGIFLGSKYNDILAIVHNSDIRYKNKKNQIILYGSLSGFPNTKYTIFNFKENKLINMTILIGYPVQISEQKYIELKEQLVEFIGNDNMNETTEKVEWTIKDNNLEFSNILGAKGYILYYIQYSQKDNDADIKNSLQNITLDKTWFNNAIDVSFGGNYNYYPVEIDTLFYNNNIIHFSYYQVFQIAPVFSFSYYIKPNFALGFECKTGYRLNLIINPLSFATLNGSSLTFKLNLPTFHDIYAELRMSNKIGGLTSQYKFLVEYGLFFITRFIAIYEEATYNSTNYLAFLETNSENLIIAFPNYYFLYGPSFFFGYEFRNRERNLNYIFGGIINIALSTNSLDEYQTTSDDNEKIGSINPFFFGFNLGFEFRVNFNYFKVLK